MNPEKTAGGPRLHICFVCSGNICRSPMAALVFRAHLVKAGMADDVLVTSAGIGPWHVGRPADSRTEATLRTAGYDVDHVAAQVGPEHLGADLLVAADRGHLADLRRLTGDPDQVRLLRSFDPSAPRGAEVPDPYYGNGDGFTDVLGMIERAVPGLLEWVRSHR